MENNPKREIERLSKENFNLKLRLHYYEQQQGLPGNEFDRVRSGEEERQVNYRVLLEEAKAVVAGLQEDLLNTRAKADRLESEFKRLEYHAQHLEDRLRDEEDKHRSAERFIESQRLDYEEALNKAQAERIEEVGEMRDKLAKEQASRLQAEEEALKCRSELDAMENQKRSTTWENLTLQNQLAKAEEDARHYRAFVDKLENEKKRGEWQSTANAGDFAKLQAELRHWKYEAEKLDAEKRRGEWRPSSAADTSRAEDEARKWRLEVERLEAEKKRGGWQRAAADELVRAEEEARYWRTEAERLRLQAATPGKEVSDEIHKWQSFARSICGSSELVPFMNHIRVLEQQRRNVDDAKTWEIFAESLTGSRSIEALEAFIGELQGRFERLARRVELTQQQKPANLQRVQQAEEKLKMATERLEKLEKTRKEQLDGYIKRIADLEEENRRLLKEITDIRFEKGISPPTPSSRRTLGTPLASAGLRPRSNSTSYATPSTNASSQSLRRNSRLNDVALSALEDLNYAASIMRRKGGS